MNYEDKYKQALSRATFYNNELPTKEQRKMLVDIFPELKESEDELTRKSLISFLKSPFVHENITDEKVTPWIAWLEKQGEQKTDPCTDCTNDKGCVTCEHGELRETHTRALNADEVIGWMKTHGNLWPRVTIKINEVIDKFKQDFGL